MIFRSIILSIDRVMLNFLQTSCMIRYCLYLCSELIDITNVGTMKVSNIML
jgi:hypothetical protein